ncbi:ABC transporter permease [Kribbella hippodromi]|uniref:ABC transporter permease n=1 Tax=Kribbella hippodromi TaxID=434347 RepID=A0ABN2E368_9ACTN
MLRYLLRRLAIAVPMLIVASFAMFMLVSLSGDPLSRFRSMDPPPPESSIRSMELELGLDRPLPERYVRWLLGVLHGDFGKSVVNVDIGQVLPGRLLISLRLIVIAIVVAAIVSIAVGVIGAVRQYGLIDNSLSVLVFVGMSLPLFWFAVMLKQWAISINRSSGRTILYTIGDGSQTGAHGLALLGFLALPTIALAVNIFASWSRYVRASMIEVLNTDYMRLARAKGLSRTQAVLRHGLRNALMPFVTVVALEFSSLVGGAVVTESVFQWRGMGDLLLNGIRNLDVHVVMAWLLVFATATILLNLLADLVYGLLDPRIRHARTF